jgi:hypothetical protein
MNLNAPRRAAQSDLTTSCVIIAMLFLTAVTMALYLYNEPTWNAPQGPRFALVRTAAGSTWVADYDMSDSDCRAIAAAHAASKCVRQED